LAQAKTDRAVTDAELLCNLPNTCAVCPQPPHVVVIHYPARTAKLFAAGSRISDSCAHAFADQVTLKLGNGLHAASDRDGTGAITDSKS
jgi:hypothetical protein